MKIRSSESVMSIYWKEYANQMVNTLIENGVSPIEIMHYVTSIFMDNAESASMVPVNDSVDSLKKVPANLGVKHKHPHKARTLSDKFLGLSVFIPGCEDSTAIIMRGYNNKVQDVYKLAATGEELTLDAYLARFIEDKTGSGSSFRNSCKVRFVINPKLSINTLKNHKWDCIKTLDDILNYRK